MMESLEDPYSGRRGVVVSGEYRGLELEILRDVTDTGWHIYLGEWDIWVDTAEDMEEWLDDPSMRISWYS
ncbi:hypothetical protein OG897_30765 [Streptomyces sp. NBC_00237]|uniref:hypothetical protein n=1 Tax=Streptomyces sp. NBC_00237 TaxID=2975687 RepID=UPI002254AB09|nr:hypothetical protein [Streptomyces sp. NBC_00237]MCX5205812.1 hypothetical protein [Streptomyces sp. NBC_00237]